MNLCPFRLVLVCSIVAATVCLQAQTPEKQAPKPANAAAQNPFDAFQSFSATLNGGIGRDHDRKIYRLRNLLRADFEDSYRVTDLVKLTSWGNSPDRCAQFVMPDASSYPFSAYHDFKVERSLTGEKETVDGHVCAIENVTFLPKDESPVVIKMKLWEAENLGGFPIKVDVDAGGGRKFNLAYTNVSLKAPDAKLFVRPAKCTAGPQAGQKGTVKLTPPTPKTPPKAPPKPQ